ncbi:MLX-interacting protein isoform X2 [Harmonia axyridis]|uniref:MLX-interacting protein isoform X2 n=1 Tax=Harmonia axyridis TaxID=115357 RepID=UPI001E276E94|nr:MLX-interacting protein isoform X2 [Harmonia axyridis]
MFGTNIKSLKVNKPERETIHSGHFMVSHFEAEEQDDEDEVAVPVPEENSNTTTIVPVKQFSTGVKDVLKNTTQQHLEIDTSLSKLFQCMTLAYRQKLTSPKWNRFRGIRLRWKEKIRLNNVIWRCWHLQFIKNWQINICQFASPLDVDTHSKPEAIVLEGKYWKRKLHAVTAEYKKWRMFHRHHSSSHQKDSQDTIMNEVGLWDSQSNESVHMLVDEDYMDLMSDTLFSTITNQPFHFPDSREIAKAGLADFIQPSLGPLQPNLDDYMDTFEQELMLSKLPTVPEEQHESIYKSPVGWPYSELDLITSNTTISGSSSSQAQYSQTIQSVPVEKTQMLTPQTIQSSNFNQVLLPIESTYSQRQPPPAPPPTYQTDVISRTKSSERSNKFVENQIMQNNTIYRNFSDPPRNIPLGICEDITTTKNPQQSQPSLSTMSEASQFKLPQAAADLRPVSNQGYKFSQPLARPNIKFTTPVSQKDENNHHSRSSGPSRTKHRSRSSTREPIKRPPLLSAVSDPALLTPTNSVLLTQLLTNNSNEETVAPQNSSVLLTQLLTNNASENSNLYRQSQSPVQNSAIRIKEESGLTTYLTDTPATTLIITSPVTFNSVPSPSTDHSMLNSFSSSNSPTLDHAAQCLNSPTSSQGSIGSPIQDSGSRDQRRVGHIHAEQKRRYNIKNGFDVIYSLIPHLNQNPNARLSKAAMLQKGAEYIRQLRQEREQLKEEMSNLRQQIESLNTSISNCQSMLPTNIAPINIRRDGKMQELFDEYVRNRTVENWKYWIFSLIFRPLLVSFNNVVSTSSMEDLYRSTILWVEQHCTLGDLRPVVLNSLRYLCTKTEILSEPERLPDEARQLCLSSSNNPS